MQNQENKQKAIPILVVGQIPPPVHGQSTMIQYLLGGEYERVKLHHVRMAFSESIDEVGSFHWKKVSHLLAIILRIVWLRITTSCRVLYYPPAGPKKNAFYRDAAILIATRWLFSKTVFHFYAAGIADLYSQIPWFSRVLYRLAYEKADLGIALFREGLRDPEFLAASKSVVIPCGTPDLPSGELGVEQPRAKPEVVTFLAMLSESKGVLVFLEACGELLRRGIEVKPIVVGWSESAAFERRLDDKVNALGLQGIVERHGKTVGTEKSSIYRRTSVFCFPSFYPSEGSPVVILEAMMFGLPVVSTKWRGIPDLVVDGETGFLVDPRDSAAVADKLEVLIQNEEIRTRMALASRKRYEELFTVQKFRDAMEEALSSLS